jgi:hypothetical protein
MRYSVVLFGLWTSLVSAGVIPPENNKPSENADKTQSVQKDLPVVKLPYVTHRASSYDPVADVSFPF